MLRTVKADNLPLLSTTLPGRADVLEFRISPTGD